MCVASVATAFDDYEILRGSSLRGRGIVSGPFIAKAAVLKDAVRPKHRAARPRQRLSARRPPASPPGIDIADPKLDPAFSHGLSPRHKEKTGQSLLAGRLSRRAGYADAALGRGAGPRNNQEGLDDWQG